MESTLTFKDDTPTSTTHALMNSATGSYRDNASSLSNPITFEVKHDLAKSADGVDRHLVRFARTDDDADGNPYTGSVHVVFALPREGVTKANLLLLWEMLRNVPDANIEEIVDGFYPSAGSV